MADTSDLIAELRKAAQQNLKDSYANSGLVGRTVVSQFTEREKPTDDNVERAEQKQRAIQNQINNTIVKLEPLVANVARTVKQIARVWAKHVNIKQENLRLQRERLSKERAMAEEDENERRMAEQVAQKKESLSGSAQQQEPQNQGLIGTLISSFNKTKSRVTSFFKRLAPLLMGGALVGSVFAMKLANEQDDVENEQNYYSESDTPIPYSMKSEDDGEGTTPTPEPPASTNALTPGGTDSLSEPAPPVLQPLGSQSVSSSVSDTSADSSFPNPPIAAQPPSPLVQNIQYTNKEVSKPPLSSEPLSTGPTTYDTERSFTSPMSSASKPPIATTSNPPYTSDTDTNQPTTVPPSSSAATSSGNIDTQYSAPSATLQSAPNPSTIVSQLVQQGDTINSPSTMIGAMDRLASSITGQPSSLEKEVREGLSGLSSSPNYAAGGLSGVVMSENQTGGQLGTLSSLIQNLIRDSVESVLPAVQNIPGDTGTEGLPTGVPPPMPSPIANRGNLDIGTTFGSQH